MPAKLPSKPCEWCGRPMRGRLRICELCRRESTTRILNSKREKGVSVTRPKFCPHRVDPQVAETPSGTASRLVHNCMGE